jgi:hypothetical protein
MRNGDDAYLRFIELYADGAAEWARFAVAYQEIADSASARDVPILLVIFPRFIPGEWTQDTYPLREIHENVASLARSLGFHVLDLTAEFASRNGDWRQWWATQYDSHPNARAHAIAAEAIARQIAATDFLGLTFGGREDAAGCEAPKGSQRAEEYAADGEPKLHGCWRGDDH